MVNEQLATASRPSAPATPSAQNAVSRELTVAVVITAIHPVRFPDAAVASCLSQTVPPAEIIVVMNGPADEQALSSHRQGTVRLIHCASHHQAAARNAGVVEAHSEYVLFLDAEDRLLPQAVASSLSCLGSRPDAGFVYGGIRLVGESRQPIGADRYEPIGKEPYFDMLKGNIAATLASAVYDRKKLLEVGGFDESLPGVDDYDLHLRLSRRHPVVSHPTTITECSARPTEGSAPGEVSLEAVLKVLDRQQSQADSDPKVTAAVEAGRRTWKEIHDAEPVSGTSGRSDAGLRRGKLPLGTAAKLSARHLWQKLRGQDPAPLVVNVDFGDFDRVRPISADFGYDRGTPVDRYYVEQFLEKQATDIQGRVLEVGDDSYSRRFGGARITKQDVLHVSASNPAATIVGSLSDVDLLPAGAFDCLVLTQTLHLIYDMPAAVRSMHRALKPGGVALVTVPGLSPIDRGEWRHTWYWFLTRFSATRLFEEVFGTGNVVVETHGNAHVATAFLQGVSLEELDPSKLAPTDDSLAILVTVVARKPQ